MTFKVRVYLQLPGGNKVRYIGERDLEERPVRGSQVIIEHEGKVETFQVDMIVPGRRPHDHRDPSLMRCSIAA